MVTFNIIEGNTNEELLIEEILKDYENLELSVEDIKKKYNISYQRWYNLTKEFKERGVQLRSVREGKWYKKHRTFRNAKYYYWNKCHNCFFVRRTIDGKTIVYGSYRTEEEAQARVRELKENGWKK